MRFLVVAAMLVMPMAAATAQSGSEGSNWARVQAVPAGTSIHLTAGKVHFLCDLKAVDAEAITCTRDAPMKPREFTFQRAEVTRVALAQRTRSGVYGGLVGMGTGAAVGEIVHTQSTQLKQFAGALPLVYGFIGLFSGSIGGYFLDLNRDTIYRVR